MSRTDFTTDQDSIHILPLAAIPLATPGLRRARLIKNVRLEGKIELFRDRAAGSGQIEPADLGRIFELDAAGLADVDVVKQLSELPSYDVYSLRVSLRRLGIPVDDDRNLRLSPAKEAEVSAHMRVFTRPLIAKVYGSDADENANLGDIVKLFVRPDVAAARQNLCRIANDLEIDVSEIPMFLSEYADVYLSLSYYLHCCQTLAPALHSFRQAIAELRLDPALRNDKATCQHFGAVESRLCDLHGDVHDVIDVFRARTADMWQDISRETYEDMRRTVIDMQARIGASLCAAKVKLDGWVHRFPNRRSGNVADRVGFLMSEMRQGLDAVEPIGHAHA